MESTGSPTPHKYNVSPLAKAADEPGQHPFGYRGTPESHAGFTTPTMKVKMLHPRSPNIDLGSKTVPNCSSFQSISPAMVRTPPAKRVHRVRNPFDAALIERLHLPMIGSPSLFKPLPPTSNALSSTQFEWTIEEVSSLKPATVEPHETQFHDSPDPDIEARAQMAISSFFKENVIVPSPVDCPLRNQRIILSEINGDTPIVKSGRRIRDRGVQTDLSLPVNLPPELEDMLKAYMKPQPLSPVRSPSGNFFSLSGSESAEKRKSESKDVSLRRKLFDMHNVVVLENEETMPPGHNRSWSESSDPNAMMHTAIAGTLSDSSDKSLLGSLSPLPGASGLNNSPNSVTKPNRQIDGFITELEECLSPIGKPLRPYRIKRSKTDDSISMDDESKMCRSLECSSSTSTSSPNAMAGQAGSIEFSINRKISRLNVNASRNMSVGESNAEEAVSKEDGLNESETNDTIDWSMKSDDECGNGSKLLGQSFHGSASHLSNTPRNTRRPTSRKNLSRSFSASWIDFEDREISIDRKKSPSSDMIHRNGQDNDPVTKIGLPAAIAIASTVAGSQSSCNAFRLDSGFNELTSSASTSVLQSLDQTEAKHLQSLNDLSPISNEDVICCSTPSKHDKMNY